MLDLRATFEKHKDEGIQNWRLVKNRNSDRKDLHALVLLDHLVPGNTNMLYAPEHELIVLDIALDKLAVVITEEQIIELIRCDVFLSYSGKYLCIST